MRNHTLTLCLALLTPVLVPLGPRAVTAQTASLEPGTRIRVTSTALHLDHVEGVVREIHDDTLALVTPYRHLVLGRVREDTARRNIPLDAVDGLEVRTGSASYGGRGAAMGAGLGAVAGVMLLIATEASPQQQNCQSGALVCFDFTQYAPLAIPALATAGVLVGGIVGSMIHHDTWKAVTVPSATTPLTLHFGRAPHGGRTVGVGMTLRF